MSVCLCVNCQMLFILTISFVYTFKQEFRSVRRFKLFLDSRLFSTVCSLRATTILFFFVPFQPSRKGEVSI